jgi:ABC-type multidrug transport system fused ATPase/permease subunit
MLHLIPRQPRSDSTVRWMFSFLRSYRSQTAVLGSLSLAEIALRASAPWPLKMIVDHLVAHRGTATLLTLVGMSLVLQLGHEVVLMVHTRVQSKLAQQMVFDLRSRLFAHFQYLPLAHHSKSSTAEAVYRLDADAGCLENLLLGALLPAVFSALTLVVMFGILVRLDVWLAGLSMIVVPFLYASLRFSMQRMRPQAERAKTLESRVVDRVYESLSSIRLVKSFAREDHEVDRFNSVAAEANRARLAVTRQESFFSFLVSAITLAGSSLILAVGGLHVIEGQLTVGTLLLIIAYLGFVYGPLSAIARTMGSLHGAMASARRVREVLALTPEARQQPGAIEPARFRGQVRFDDVSFSYGPGRLVLDGVSFTANPGETVALVGLSGAGKSTLAALIARMYEPSSGRVLIDGVDISRYRLKSLREQIAVVLQESVLLSGSIGQNILYGNLDANHHDVLAAARAAHVEEFVAALRHGYDTPVGNGGAQLSGGQRQRLSIARAFLKDAPILSLDEPTAALDTVSEQAVLRALARLRHGRTTFVIAHRLSTVRNADRILVLDAGRIAAEGTHDELLRTTDLYRQLCAQLDPVGSDEDVLRSQRFPH